MSLAERIGGEAPCVPILFITHPFVPATASGAARSLRFYKYLPRFGWEPWVVSCSVDTPNVPYPRVYRLPPPNPSAADRRWEYLAERTQRYLFPVNDAFEWVPYAVRSGAELIQRHGIRHVLSTSPPVAAHYAAGWLARRFGLRWVADFRDPVADNPFRKRRWIFPYDAWLERAIVRGADAVIANTSDFAASWKQRYPQYASKLSVIWNGFDPEGRPHPAPLASRKQRVLAHIGQTYGGRKPTLLADSLNRLIANGKLDPATIVLEMVGESLLTPDPAYDQAMESLRARGCLIATGQRMPKEAADRKMAEADYLLLLDLNDAGRSIQVPAKLFDYMCVGRPILAFSNEGSPAARILEQSEIDHCFLAPDAAPERVDRSVLEFLSRGVREATPNEWFWSSFDGCEQAKAVSKLLGGNASV